MLAAIQKRHLTGRIIRLIIDPIMEPIEVAIETAQRVSDAAKALRDAAAHSPALYTPELDAVLQAAADLQERSAQLRNALNHVKRPAATQRPERAVASILPLIERAREISKEFDSALDNLRKNWVLESTELLLKETGRTFDRWHQRWGEDGIHAEIAYRYLAQRAREDPLYREHASYDTSLAKLDADLKARVNPNLNDVELSIAELYYYGSLSQAEVGRFVGLSQPSVGARLAKIDRCVAEHLLATRLAESAALEGWKVGWETSISFGALDFRFDLLARREDDGPELGIEIKVADDASFGRLKEWWTYLSAFDPPTVVALAVYTLSDNTAGLYVMSDYETALKKLGPSVGQGSPPDFSEVKALMPTDLSLNAALERARK